NPALFLSAEASKIAYVCQGKSSIPNRHLQFHKHTQLFIRTHNEPLSMIAMCVSNEDWSPAANRGSNAAPTATGFAEIVSDDFPVFHVRDGDLAMIHGSEGKSQVPRKRQKTSLNL